MIALTRKIYALFNRRERLSVVWLAALGIAAGLSDTVGIGLIIPYVALLMDPEGFASHHIVRQVLEAVGPMSTDTMVIAVTCVITLAFIAKTAVALVSRYAQARFTSQLQIRLGAELIRRYLNADPSFHMARNSAELVRNVNAEIRVMSHAVVLPLFAMVSEAFVVLGILALLLLLSPAAVFGAAGFFGLLAFAFQRALRRRLRRHARERHRLLAARLRSINQALGAMKELRVLGRLEHFARLYDQDNTALAHTERFHLFVNQLPRTINEAVLVVALLPVVAAAKLWGGNEAVLLPMILLFAVAAVRLLPAVSHIMSSLSNLTYLNKTVESLHLDMTTLARAGELPPPSRPAVGRFDRAFGPIRFENVRFRYPGAESEAVAGIDLVIPAGQAVALVGPSGSGKSTLVDLLVGLIRPTEGRILADGQDIAGDIENWQRRIGYIPQRLYLIDDTIRRNIALGLADDAIEPSRIENAARLARLDNLLAGLPRGLDTPVGELGGRLSGGQRQRICIARALYHDPALVVMDEATAALDQASEREIIEALRAFRGAKTIVMVAHRLASVRHCDHVYFVVQGRVVASGGYEELVRTDARFRAFAAAPEVEPEVHARRVTG